jgi:hypothetical protein
MPLRHGLEVSIISSRSEAFREYGVSTHARSKLVTAKIEAKTGVRFLIAIRPESPFPAEQDKSNESSVLTRSQSGELLRPLTSMPHKPTQKQQLSDLKMKELGESDDHPLGEPGNTLFVDKLPIHVDEARLAQEFYNFHATRVCIIRAGVLDISKGYATLFPLHVRFYNVTYYSQLWFY